MTASRPVTPRKKPKPVLVGLDEDVMAAVATVDPDPVDRLGEVVALLGGRASYSLIAGELHFRDPVWHVLDPRYPCVVEHSCGRPIPGRPVSVSAKVSEVPNAPAPF